MGHAKREQLVPPIAITSAPPLLGGTIAGGAGWPGSARPVDHGGT